MARAEGGLDGSVWGGRRVTHVVEDSLHEGDGDFGLLHQVVLCVLDLDAGGLLLCRASVLQASNDT